MNNKKSSRTTNVKRNIFFSFVGKILPMILSFVTRTMLLYLIGTKSVGVNTLFSSILSFLNLSELGVGSAIVYFMYRPLAEDDTDKVNAILNYYKKLYHMIGLAILLFGLVLLPFLSVLTNGEAPEGTNIYILYLIYLGDSVLSHFVGGYRRSVLRASQRKDVIEKITVIVHIAVRIVEIAVIAITKNMYAYAIVAVVGTMTSNILIAIVSKKMFPEIQCSGDIDPELKKGIQKRLVGLFGTKLSSVVLHQADTIVITAFLGLTAVTEYGNYYYIMNLVSTVIKIIFDSMTASIGNKIVTGTKKDLYKLFRRISFFNYWLVGWCSVCLLCLYQPFMQLWVKDSLMLEDGIMISLVFYFFFDQIRRTILTFKDAYGLWYENRYCPYVSMIVNLVSNIIMVQYIGLYGIIFSTILSFFISIPWNNAILFNNEFDEKHYKNLLRIIHSLVVTCLAAIPSYYICSFMPEGIVGLLLRGIICIMVPNIIFYLIYHKYDGFEFFKTFVSKEIKSVKRKLKI